MSRNASQDTDGPVGMAPSTRIGEQALQFVRLCRKWAQSGHSFPVLRSLTLYPPSASRNGQWLVVAKALGDGVKLVAFSRSPDPFTALLGILQKIAGARIDWKEDTYDPTAWRD